MTPHDPPVDAAPVDEDRRRRFEAHRLGGGSEPVEAFLPDAAHPSWAGTLEELVAIDLEVRWKRWAAEGGDDARAPDLTAYAATLAAAGGGVADRLAREHDALRARFRGGHRPRPGLRVAHYVLRERAGRGAFSEVWRAWDETLHRDVAVKLPRAELADDAGVVARLLREARSAARLRHPGIVSVHETGEADGRPYVVSDFVAGETLAAAMRARRFTADEAARVALALAEALDYAHACGVVHRDVKPGNVLLPPGGGPVLTDFGLAQLRAADVALTRRGEILGTPAYMPPEQARGDAPDARSDVYSLGVVLYEMLTGTLPFEADSSDRLLYAVVHEEPVPPRARAAGVPQDLETICLRAMAKEPARRYPGARALAEDLRRWLDRLPIHARPLGAWGRLRLWARRNPAVAGTIAASAVVVAGVGGVAFARVVAERDRTEAALVRALVAEAEALIRARDSEWFDRATASLREAAARPTADRDVDAIREIVVRAHAAAVPAFRRRETWPAHGGVPVQLAAAPSGRRCVALAKEGTLCVRELPGGRVVATADLAAADPRHVVYVLGGARVAVGGGDGTVRLLDAETLAAAGEPARGDGEVLALAASAAGDLLAVGRADGIDLLRAGAGGLAWERRVDGHPDGTVALAFSPDGGRLASGGLDRTLRVRDLATGGVLVTHRTSDPPRLLHFPDTGDEVAWSAWEMGGMGIVPLAPGAPPRTWNGLHLAPLRHLAYVPLGNLVTTSTDGTVRAWSRQAHPSAVARGDGAPCATAAALPGASAVVVAYADGTFVVWDLFQPPGRDWLHVPHMARFLPGTSRLVSGIGTYEVAADGTVTGATRAYGVDSVPTALARPFPVPAVRALTPSADGAGVVVVGDEGPATAVPADPLATSPDGRLVARAGEGGVLVADAATGDVVDRLRVDQPTAAAFGGGGAVYVGTAGGAVWAWTLGGAPPAPDARPRAPERPVVVGTDREQIWGVAVSPDGRWFATTSHEGTVKLWDASALRPVRALSWAGEIAWSAAFSPDARTLAACSGEDVVLWSVPDGRELARLPGHRRFAIAAAFHPTLPVLVTAGGHALRVWDVRDGRAVGDLHRGTGSCLQLEFTRDGRALAAASQEGCALVWTDAERALRTMLDGGAAPAGPDRRVAGGGGTVWAVAFDAAGRRLATGTERGVVALHDTATWSPLVTLTSDVRQIRSLAFDERGDVLVAGCYTSISIAWHLPTLRRTLAEMGLDWE